MHFKAHSRRWRPRTGLKILVALLVGLLPWVQGTPADRPDFDRKARKDMEFAAEMAEKGLWREALYRWNRVHERYPDDPRLLNNIAVAHEALGQPDKAREAYEKAMKVASISEISANQALFAKAASQEEGDSDTGGGS
jgi:tetratricopeptide (TPR) repeat protein